MTARESASRSRPESRLRRLMEAEDRFVLAVEVQTNRGLITDERAVGLTRVARELADSGRVDVICISDNPFGSPHLESQVLGADLLSRGQEVVINFSCKDLNRNAIESRLWALGSAGLHNVLAVTGDYPLDGFAGAPRPVFDTDSVGLLEMMRRMNQGLPTSGRTGERGSGRLQPTAFYPAATVNPFKRREDELVPQFRKLVKKVSVGARWIITQLGFDFRRLDELRRFTRLSGLDAPFIGSVYVLDLPAARYFRRGAVPGVSISDGLLELIERRAGGKDRGRAFFNEFAAKQTAILRGLGFRGVYMCCRSPLARFDEILEIESTLDAGDWRDFVRELSFPERGGFYLYEADGDTGLSRDELSREYLASKSKRRGRLKRLSYPGAVLYGANRLVHETLFKPERAGFRLGRALYRRAERSRTAGRLLHAAEQAFKIPVYGCEDCGDCSLAEVAYLCPEGQCYKNQRNGPCGGSRNGICEVGDKECIWSRAYKRLKAFGEEDRMLERPVVLQNAGLRRTSAWANAFLGRDHAGLQRTKADAAG